MTLHAFMSGNVQMVWGFCSILNVPDLIDNRKSQTSYYAVSCDQFSVIQSKLYVWPPFVNSHIFKTPKFSQSNHYSYLELLVKSHLSKATASTFLDEHFRIFRWFVSSCKGPPRTWLDLYVHRIYVQRYSDRVLNSLLISPCYAG